MRASWRSSANTNKYERGINQVSVSAKPSQRVGLATYGNEGLSTYLLCHDLETSLLLGHLLPLASHVLLSVDRLGWNKWDSRTGALVIWVEQSSVQLVRFSPYLSASASFSAFISRSRCLIASCFLRCSSFFSHGVVFFLPAIVLCHRGSNSSGSRRSVTLQPH